MPSIIRGPMRALCVVLLVAALAACSAEPRSNPLLDLLHARDFAALDAKLGGLQRRFEHSEVSELELRNTYRAFYSVDRDGVDAVNEWIAMRPKSYPAQLIRGMGFKIAAMSARGTGPPPKSGSERSKAQSWNFQIADSELMQSLPLTAKPLLSVLQLEAIMEDDIGLSLFEKGQRTDASLHLAKALELAKGVGGSFQSDG